MSAEQPIARSIEEIRERVEFDPETGEHHVHVDLETVRPSVAAAALLAAVRDDDVLDLAPLAETVDPDMLDKLLRSLSGAAGVVVTIEDYQIALTAPGRLWARREPGGPVWPGAK